MADSELEPGAATWAAEYAIAKARFDAESVRAVADSLRLGLPEGMEYDRRAFELTGLICARWKPENVVSLRQIREESAPVFERVGDGDLDGALAAAREWKL